MRRAKTIRVINDMPHLLEAVANHPDCPEWLPGGIVDAINNQDTYLTYSAACWANLLDQVKLLSEEAEAAAPQEDYSQGLRVIEGGIQ